MAFPRLGRAVKARRVAAFALALILAVAAYRYFFPQPPTVSLPEELPLDENSSVLVFSPHSDDEVLGPGGLIKLALSQGSRVRVVLMTNGDGFTAAAGEAFRTLRVTPEEYIKLALIRQQESLNALGYLGLPGDRVTFLGYPDGGLAHLWETNWDPSKLYVSRYTKRDRSPYANSYTPNAPYYGLSVVADVKKILSETKPTIIMIPHPNDAHPDHWATNQFVRYALEELREAGEPFVKDVRVYLYLVHRGDWPAPKGRHLTGELVPPAPLLNAGTNWFRLELDQETTWAKYQAILKYESQVRVLRRYLVSFARRNELFGTIPNPTVPLVPDGSIKVDGDSTDWSRIDPVMMDPVADTLARQFEAAADLRAVYAAVDSKNLYLRIETRKAVSPRVKYLLRLRPLGVVDRSKSPAGANLQLELTPPSTAVVRGAALPVSGVVFRSGGTTLEASIPLVGLGRPSHLFIGADTWRVVRIDKMAWTLVPLPVQPGSSPTLSPP